MTRPTIHPAQAIPIRLVDSDQGIHLTQNWQVTLCGKRIMTGMTWPDHYQRADCSECWQLAQECGLKVESQA